MEDAIAQQVLDSLLGHLLPEYHLNWVETIFVPGHPCYEEYGKMYDTYPVLCSRLGAGEEDPDVERMVDALLNHGRILALEMFEYGRKYQRMLDAE